MAYNKYTNLLFALFYINSSRSAIYRTIINSNVVFNPAYRTEPSLTKYLKIESKYWYLLEKNKDIFFGYSQSELSKLYILLIQLSKYLSQKKLAQTNPSCSKYRSKVVQFFNVLLTKLLNDSSQISQSITREKSIILKQPVI